MWEVKYNPTSETADSLDMVLLDEQGSQIHALIKKDLIPHFKEVAKEGSVYTISHFGVGNNKRSYQQVQNDNIIWFNSFTSLKFEPEGLVDIPMHKISFQPFEHLAERNNRKDILTGNYQLNSTSGTKVHINLDIPEVHAFRESITGGHPNKIEMIQVQQPETIEETMKKTGKTIKELQELYNGVEENQTNATYTCVGMITKVLDQECGWKYSSCNICKSKLDNCQYCNKCNLTPQFPLNRTTINVGIFDKDVEKIVGKPITAMMKIYEQVKINKRGYIQELTAMKIFEATTTPDQHTNKGQSKPDLQLEADIATAIKLSMEEQRKKMEDKLQGGPLLSRHDEKQQQVEDSRENKHQEPVRKSSKSEKDCNSSGNYRAIQHTPSYRQKAMLDQHEDNIEGDKPKYYNTEAIVPLQDSFTKCYYHAP
ncbi:Replication protein A 70 kDa DNA-binding subunit A [Bienertia sinuspersici]